MWKTLDEKQKEIVGKISSQFPYRTEDVVIIYKDNKCSEKETREILQNRLEKGW